MRRLISMLAAGLLAGGTVVAGGIASAGTTAARQASCADPGTLPVYVTRNNVSYYLGTPRNLSPGAAAILKPNPNSTTMWTFCELGSSSTYVVSSQNQGLALTSRASSPGADVTVETAGNSGSGFASQRWDIVGVSSDTWAIQNVKTGLFLRVRNSGPVMSQTVTTGSSPTGWTLP
jgi:hypothetical protein